MVTNGDFQTIFDAAKMYETDSSNLPMQPVVRKYDGFGGAWHIDSGLSDEPRATLECTLEEFQSYFYECDDDYIVTDDIEQAFTDVFTVDTDDEYEF